MRLCSLCGFVTWHEAEFMLVYENGGAEKTLRVCHFCKEDLEVLGFNALQTIRLEASKPKTLIPLELLVLGPVGWGKRLFSSLLSPLKLCVSADLSAVFPKHPGGKNKT